MPITSAPRRPPANLHRGERADAAKTGEARVRPKPSSRLLALADPATVTSPEQLISRLQELERALAGDGRVVFPAVYREITRRSLAVLPKLQDPTTGAALVVAFGRRYLEALSADLRGEEVPPAWRSHFEKATGRAPSLRGVAAAVNAHLSYDLAEALLAVKATPAFAKDFTLFGEELAAGTDDVIRALARHQVDADGFFRGYGVGRAVDTLFGEGTTSRLAFQTIRAEAWANGQSLLRCTQHPALTRAAMLTAVRARELSLDMILR